MLSKIVSGGQTGADQAALDAAIELGFPHGGWVPKGRKTESGPLWGA
jgi:Circularly permutated YpsA SLOG family